MKNKLLSTLFALISTLGFSQAPSYVPVNGLVGWWPFNGNADDESGNLNSGNVNGTTLNIDRFGNTNSSYSFDGINDFIDLGTTTSLNSLQLNYTVSYWINKSDNDNGMVIASFAEGFAGEGWRYHSAVRGDSVDSRFMRSDNNNWAINYSNQGSIILNNWINICNVRNGTNFSTYINGILSSNTIVPNVSINNAPQNTLATTKIGVNWPSVPAEYFGGKIDDIGIWNRALTDCEIQNLYTSSILTNLTSQTSCDSYTWNGTTYSASGVYTGTTTDCVTQSLNLTINTNTSSFISQTALDSYTWPVNNQTYTTTGAYTAVIPNASGCDSTITLNLTMSFTGINDISYSKLSIYPNPTNGDFTITGLELVGTISSLNLTDMNGKVVKVLDTKATKFSMGSIKPGVYFLNIRSGNKQEVLKIVKE